MKIIDSHAHLNDGAFDEDRRGIIASLNSDGIEAVFNIGADLPTSEESVSLADEYANIYAVVGVHPHDASTYDIAVENRLVELINNPKVVAVGEIGLDYHYDLSPRDVQQEVFERQLRLAERFDMPVVIHSREATADTLDILKRNHYENRKVLLHCYSGSVETMKILTEMGYYIALGGAVTFKNAKTPKEVAAVVPIDRLLLETDCPYMTPVPYRGKRNEPKYISLVAQEIASLRGITPEELIAATNANTMKFYGVKL